MISWPGAAILVVASLAAQPGFAAPFELSDATGITFAQADGVGGGMTAWLGALDGDMLADAGRNDGLLAQSSGANDPLLGMGADISAPARALGIRPAGSEPIDADIADGASETNFGPGGLLAACAAAVFFGVLLLRFRLHGQRRRWRRLAAERRARRRRDMLRANGAYGTSND